MSGQVLVLLGASRDADFSDNILMRTHIDLTFLHHCVFSKEVQIPPGGPVSVGCQDNYRGTISIPPHWTPDNNYHYSEHLGFRYQYKTLSAPETIAI